MVDRFSVISRNIGHWDVYLPEGRAYRIRGGPGKYKISDERRGKDSSWKIFKTLSSAMQYICEELMYELIVAEGQEPSIIESWNIE